MKKNLIGGLVQGRSFISLYLGHHSSKVNTFSNHFFDTIVDPMDGR